jgi:hypothetical protein
MRFSRSWALVALIIAAALTAACSLPDVTGVAFVCIVDGDTLFLHGNAGGGADLTGVRCADIDSLAAAIDSIIP